MQQGLEDENGGKRGRGVRGGGGIGVQSETGSGVVEEGPRRGVEKERLEMAAGKTWRGGVG